VGIEVKLKAEGCPGGHPQITQPQLLVDEVEVVMDTLGFGVSKGGSFLALGVVGLKAGTVLHGGEDVHQPRMVASLSDNLLDPLFFSELPLPTDIFDFQSMVSSQSLCILSNLVAKRLSPTRVVEEANLSGVKIQSQSIFVADLGNGSTKDDSVKAGEDSTDLVAVTLGQEFHSDLRRTWALAVAYRNGKEYCWVKRIDENTAFGLMVWSIR
jgi:hypothetical protein